MAKEPYTSKTTTMTGTDFVGTPGAPYRPAQPAPVTGRKPMAAKPVPAPAGMNGNGSGRGGNRANRGYDDGTAD